MQNKPETKQVIKPRKAWVEFTPEGLPMFCYSGKSHGERFEEKLTIEQIQNFLQDYKEKNLENKNKSDLR